MASEDLIKEVIPSASTKDDVSPLPLPSPVPATLYLCLDSILATSAEIYGVHLSDSSKTVLLKGSDMARYLESLGGKVQVVDFEALKAAAPPAPPPSAKAAA